MAYCTKCGRELRQDDRFCANCGAPVSQPQSAPSSPPPPPQSPARPVQPPPRTAPVPAPYPQPKKPRKGLLIGITAGSVLAAVLVLALAVSFFTRRTVEPVAPQVSAAAEDSGTESLEEAAETPPPPAEETVYAEYTNSSVLFSLEYPEGCELTEPNQNNVLIRDGEGLQITAEYAYTTQSQSYVYSAGDFAAQLDRDPQVLRDWLGVDTAEPAGSGVEQIAGTDAYVYDFTLELSDGPYIGRLCLLDGRGDLGCYTLTTVYPAASDKASLYEEQCAHAADSLRVNGAYTPEGIRVFRCEAEDYSFLMGDSLTGEVKIEGSKATVYPVEKVFTKCRITLDESVYDPDDGEPWDVLTRRAMNLLSDKESHSNGFTRQDFSLGRYEYVGLSAEYTEGGAGYQYLDVLFEHDGEYWVLSCRFTPEYQDAAYAAVSDILASLRFGEEAGISRAGQSGGSQGEQSASAPSDEISLNKAAASLLRELEDEDLSRDYEPLISVTDLDGDGSWELLASWVEKDDGAYEVKFALWTTQGDNLVELAEDTLYTQAGGNTGTVGLAKREDACYLTLYTSRPQDQTFHRYYRYAPISLGNDDLEEGNVLMESHVVYQDGEINSGNYKVGGKTVNQGVFDSAQKEFRGVVTLDLMKGPDASGLSMTWDQAKSYDFDNDRESRTGLG